MFGNPIFNSANKAISLSGILSKTGKVLNVANKAIPIYYQVKPIFKNSKSFLKMFNGIIAEPKEKNITNNIKKESLNNKNNTLTFFN